MKCKINSLGSAEMLMGHGLPLLVEMAMDIIIDTVE
jgi:hypothetical protein